jgi:hypothetical protein
MAEKLQFDILANDRASETFSSLGRKASAASDDVLGLGRRLDEVGRKSATATVGLAGNKEAQAQLDKLDLKLLTLGRRVTDPKISIDGAAKASAEISALDVEMDKLIAKSAETEAAVGAGAGGLSGPSGMGALIGAGVVLSPVLTTVAFGLGGFGVAAAGAVAPIVKAAGATGGLAANMGKLDPEQRGLALSVLGLGKEYDQFQKSLQPEVLNVFGRGIQFAGDVMHAVQPVAVATGKAIGGVLGQVDAEFKSGTWTNFFSFMAKTAGPDIALLGNTFTDVLNVLPGLITDLQPVTVTLLKDADAAVKFVGALVKVYDAEQNFIQNTKDSSGWLGKLGHAAGDAFNQLIPGSSEAKKLGGDLQHMGAQASGPGASGINAVTAAAKPAATQLQMITTALTGLDNLLSDQSAQVAWKQSQIAATKAVQAGSSALDGNSSKQLANRQLVIDSTQKTEAFANIQATTGHNIDGATKTLQNQIRFLQSTGDKSDWVTAQIKGLKKAEDALKNRHLMIDVDAHGQYSVQAIAAAGGHGGDQRLLGGAAAGAFVTGGVPGRDSVLARVMPGELIVPTPMVSSGAVDHLRGRIPGFAAGGLVGSYSGAVGGLGPWLTADTDAFAKILEGATAKAASAGLAAAAAQSAGGVGGGVSRWAGTALQALALLGQPASDLGTVLSQMSTESGGNPLAVNLSDSNAAAGTPSVGLMQVIGPTFAANAGPFGGTGPFAYGTSENPLANIFAGLHYAIGRYGDPGWTGVLGHGHGYDSGGWLPPGTTMAVNKTGRSERVVSPAQNDQIVSVLLAIHDVLAASPAATAAGITGVYGAVARAAGYRALYGNR